MKVLYALSQFLISEWIFSVTLALGHILINSLLLTLLLVIIEKRSLLQGLFLAFGAQLFATGAFTLIARFFLGVLCGVTFSPEEVPTLIHPFWTSFLLGVIYAGLQSFFFYMISWGQQIAPQRYALLCVVSNFIAALLVYWLLPTTIG